MKKLNLKQYVSYIIKDLEFYIGHKVPKKELKASKAYILFVLTSAERMGLIQLNKKDIKDNDV